MPCLPGTATYPATPAVNANGEPPMPVGHQAAGDGRFASINRAYDSVFRPHRLSIGLVLPLERYPVGGMPGMRNHLERARLAESLGFSALWLRDVPFHVPSFGDPGQLFDPFVYLGMLAAATRDIALGTASVILPLRHPAHVAKAAASVDVLSGGRLLLGVASGDRPEEYPAMNLPFEDRGERFRTSFDYIRRMAEQAPSFDHPQGSPSAGMDLLPKPVAGRLPMLVTGASQQSPAWLAQHGDGWITYPRAVATQARIVGEWRARGVAAGRPARPAVQSLYVDLLDSADATPQPIHLGFRSGMHHLRGYLRSLEEIGINHVALNLRFNQAALDTTLRRLADELLPDFHPGRG